MLLGWGWQVVFPSPVGLWWGASWERESRWVLHIGFKENCSSVLRCCILCKNTFWERGGLSVQYLKTIAVGQCVQPGAGDTAFPAETRSGTPGLCTRREDRAEGLVPSSALLQSMWLCRGAGGVIMLDWYVCSVLQPWFLSSYKNRAGFSLRAFTEWHTDAEWQAPRALGLTRYNKDH